MNIVYSKGVYWYHLHINMYVYRYRYTCTYTHSRTYTHILTHAHTHIHTYTHVGAHSHTAFIHIYIYRRWIRPVWGKGLTHRLDDWPLGICNIYNMIIYFYIYTTYLYVTTSRGVDWAGQTPFDMCTCIYLCLYSYTFNIYIYIHIHTWRIIYA